MARLTTYDDPISRCLAQARIPLQIEHDLTGDYFGPRTQKSEIRNQKSEIDLLRRTVERWCDWLDAANHLHVHQLWHHVPIYFDTDVEKRDLASVGLVQRNYSELNDWMKGAWQHSHAKLAQQFHHSPKWFTVGQAMASQAKRLWTYHEVDTRIIYLWPLLKKYNWTYRDLMNVVRSLRSDSQLSTKAPQLRPDAYPCQREQDFAVHCRTVLGLRKTGRGKTTKNGNPPGNEIARRIFPAASPL